MFDFKKNFENEIRVKIAPLLKNNGFKKYKKTAFVREKDNLAQIISFQVKKDQLKAFAIFLPIYVPNDDIMNFGIEITGSCGVRLLNGKYFRTIYEKEKYDLTIQEENYQKIHLPTFENMLIPAILEGVIPEMNEVDSLSKFIYILRKGQDGCFFGNRSWGMSGITNYILAVYEVFEGKDANSYAVLSNINKTLAEYPCKSVDLFHRYVLTLLSAFDNEGHVDMTEYKNKLNILSDEMRKKYNLNPHRLPHSP